jgi:hypothetical protein
MSVIQQNSSSIRDIKPRFLSQLQRVGLASTHLAGPSRRSLSAKSTAIFALKLLLTALRFCPITQFDVPS